MGSWGGSPLEGSGELCELPQWDSVRAPAQRPKVFHYFQHSGWFIVSCPRVHFSEGPLVRNVVVQIPKFDAKPNPNLTLTMTLILTL